MSQQTVTAMPVAATPDGATPVAATPVVAATATEVPVVEGAAEVPIVEGVQIPFDAEPSRGSRGYGGPAVVCILHEHAGRVPPGLPPGGRWIEMGYFGPTTALCCCLTILLFWPAAFCVPLCPCDTKPVYQAPNGVIYDVDPFAF